MVNKKGRRKTCLQLPAHKKVHTTASCDSISGEPFASTSPPGSPAIPTILKPKMCTLRRYLSWPRYVPVFHRVHRPHFFHLFYSQDGAIRNLKTLQLEVLDMAPRDDNVPTGTGSFHISICGLCVVATPSPMVYTTSTSAHLM